MNVINERRNELSGVPFLNNAIDGLTSRINHVFRQEHTDDGAHTDITATSVTAEGNVLSTGDSQASNGARVGDAVALLIAQPEAAGVTMSGDATTHNAGIIARFITDTFVESDGYPASSFTADVTKMPMTVIGDMVPFVDDAYYLGYQASGDFQRRWRSVYVSRVVHSPRIVATTGLFSAGQVVITAVISPSITADQNDWSPAGLSTARIIRLSTDASRNITGLEAQQSGTLLSIININVNDAVLVNESGASAAANRFICPGGANYTLTSGSAASLWYDGTSTRWRFLHS
jgi:hypothetical protein